MLRAVTERERGRILSLSGSPQLTVRLQALLAAYGVRQRFFEVWVQNRDSFLLRLDGHFEFLRGPDAEPEEIAVMLSCSPAFASLSGEAEAVQTVADQLPFFTSVSRHSILGWHGPSEADIPVPAGAVRLDPMPKLWEIYDLLKGMAGEGFNIGQFDGWYVDFSHRLRHGCAQVCLLRENGEPAACCLVTARSRHAGLIGGLATRKDRRGRGYASLLLADMVSKLRAARLLPVLECGDNLLEFYTRQGFLPLSEGASLMRASSACGTSDGCSPLPV